MMKFRMLFKYFLPLSFNFPSSTKKVNKNLFSFLTNCPAALSWGSGFNAGLTPSGKESYLYLR